jgi:hypothetical protein
VLLRGRFLELENILSTVLDQILTVWQKPEGYFRTRQLLLGWDDTPMHRWGQSQTFRSLCFLLRGNIMKDALLGRQSAGRDSQQASMSAFSTTH